jgi:hypothetical protein
MRDKMACVRETTNQHKCEGPTVRLVEQQVKTLQYFPRLLALYIYIVPSSNMIKDFTVYMVQRCLSALMDPILFESFDRLNH